MNEKIFTNSVAFKDLSLSVSLQKAIKDINYEHLTKIQAQAIPILLDGHDLIGRSNTGTGKTAAFGLPAIEMLDEGLNRPQVLIVSPTRELAIQIAEEFKKFGKYKDGMSIATIYGGVAMQRQIQQLKQANVIVGTPGRILDHINRRTLKLQTVKYVVLDEADEMLSMGFIEDIESILSKTPDERQTALFSATMPPSIRTIADRFLKNPKTVNVIIESDQKSNIDQSYYVVNGRAKKEALNLLLLHHNSTRTIIFSNTKSMVDELAKELRANNFKAAGLHGDMPQNLRGQVLKEFKEGHTHILIATDVAARGIDVDNVDVVINYDLPQSHEYYVHRIGRTGRAGKLGVSLTLISGRAQIYKLKELMFETKMEIEEKKLPKVTDLIDRQLDIVLHKLTQDIKEKTSDETEILMEKLLTHELTYKDIAYLALNKILKSELTMLETPGLGQNIQSNYVDNITLSIGRKDKIKPKQIVESMTKTFKIKPKAIGNIIIKDRFTTVDLDSNDIKMIMDKRKSLRINGQTVLIDDKPIVSSQKRQRRNSKKVMS